jgi:hypothetical protein
VIIALRQIVWTLLILLVGMPAFSQIVNVEGKRNGGNQPGLHGSLDLNFSYTRNTQDVLTYGGKTNLQYLKKHHRVLLLADLSRVQAGGADFVNQGFEHIRYNYSFGEKERFAFEGFQQAQFNSVQLIGFRHLTGAGLRYSPIDRDSIKLWCGTLPMFEYEELTTGIIERNLRQSSYLLFFLALKKFEFQSITYYQPRWGDWGDYRLSTNNTLEFGILKWLRYALTLNLLYDSKVPEGVPATVFTLRNGLRLEF